MLELLICYKANHIHEDIAICNHMECYIAQLRLNISCLYSMIFHLDDLVDVDV